MGITKLIRRSVGIMSLSLLIILLANLTLLTVFALRSTAGGHPWTMAAETASALQRTDSGYALDAGQAQALESEGAWAVLVDTGTLSVSWHTENAPAAALEQYTAAGIAMLTRGYIDDCPTFTASTENGDLVVVGFPDGSYWKHMYPSWDYDLIANAPLLFFILLAFNLLLVMGIYVAANSRLYKSVRPIEEGVEALPTLMGTPVRERGLLAPLAQSINRTAEILRSQRAELRRKDMARSEWISGVSHDIRTPLTSIVGATSAVLENPGLSPDDQRELLEDARADAQWLIRVVENLLSITRIGDTSAHITKQPEAAEEVLGEAVRKFRKRFPQIRVQVQAPGDLLMVPMDPILIEQVLSNLLENAVIHGKTTTEIRLSVWPDSGYARFSVEDNGQGIPKKELPTLFDGTLKHNETASGDGKRNMGLGLSVCLAIVRAHGGMMDASNLANGAVFSFRLPLFEEEKT